VQQQKKSRYGFKAYPYPNILIPLANWTLICFHSKKISFFLKFNAKKGEAKLVLPSSTFQSVEDNYPQLLRTCEVQTADSYGASEFMQVRILVVFVSIFSFLCIRNFLSAIKYLYFCYAIPVYLYHLLLLK